MLFAQAYDPFRALGEAWKLGQRALGALLLGGTLLFFTEGGGGFAGGVGEFRERVDGITAEQLAVVVLVVSVACVFGLAMFLLHCWLRLGFANYCQRLVRGEEQIELGELFRANGSYWGMVLAQGLRVAMMFLAGLPFAAIGLVSTFAEKHGGVEPVLIVVAAVVALLVYLPVYVYVGLGVTLVPEAVAIEGLGPLEAVARSWSLARGHRLQLLLFSIVMFFVSAAGFCLCCFGVFGTYTWTEFAKLESYIQLVRPPPVPPAS